ncbi:MAG: flavin reductase [Deltaproteobacteria bacterium]|nr:flavin reductase [Deltaproteobacteria bacterium]
MKLGDLERKQCLKGVYIITTRLNDRRGGMTASWVCRAAQSPPVMSAAIHLKSHTGQLIKESQRFVIHLISREEMALARRFGLSSGHKKDKFQGLDLTESGGGLPVLSQALGYMECQVIDQVAVYDHTLFLGLVVEEKLFRRGQPLIFSRREFEA